MKWNKQKVKDFFQNVNKPFLYVILTTVTLIAVITYATRSQNNKVEDLDILHEVTTAEVEKNNKTDKTEPQDNTTTVEDVDSTEIDETKDTEKTEDDTVNDIADTDNEVVEENTQEDIQEEKKSENTNNLASNSNKQEPKESNDNSTSQADSNSSAVKQTEKKVKETVSNTYNQSTTPPGNEPKSDSKPEQKPEVKAEPKPKKQQPVSPTQSQPEPKPAPAPKPEVSSTQKTNEFQAEVLRLVNIERDKAGLNRLSTNSALNNAATLRAKELQQSFSHTRPDGQSPFTVLKEFNITFYTAGENIAMNYQSPQAVVDGWMNSPGHRENILNGSFNQLGVGVFRTDQTPYQWVQLFVGN